MPSNQIIIIIMKHFTDLSVSSWQFQLRREQDGVYERVCGRLQCDQVRVEIQLSASMVSPMSIVYGHPDKSLSSHHCRSVLDYTVDIEELSENHRVSVVLTGNHSSPRHNDSTMITIGDSKVVTGFTPHYRRSKGSTLIVLFR